MRMSFVADQLNLLSYPIVDGIDDEHGYPHQQQHGYPESCELTGPGYP
jgi:hypothetical protein